MCMHAFHCGLFTVVRQVGTQATQIKESNSKMKKMKLVIDKLKEDNARLEAAAASSTPPMPLNFRVRSRVLMDWALTGSGEQMWCFVEYSSKVRWS
jgi:hypothetical protein